MPSVLLKSWALIVHFSDPTQSQLSTVICAQSKLHAGLHTLQASSNRGMRKNPVAQLTSAISLDFGGQGVSEDLIYCQKTELCYWTVASRKKKCWQIYKLQSLSPQQTLSLCLLLLSCALCGCMSTSALRPFDTESLTTPNMILELHVRLEYAQKQPEILMNSSHPADSARSSAFESHGHLAFSATEKSPFGLGRVYDTVQFFFFFH